MSWITSLAMGLVMLAALFVIGLVAIHDETTVERRLVKGERKNRAKRVAAQMERVRRIYPDIDGEL